MKPGKLLFNTFAYTMIFACMVFSVYGASAVDLGTAGNFAILAKSGISATGVTTINGNIGVSPIDATAITGFGLIMDSSNQFSTSSLVNGSVYAADYSPPTPAIMTAAISDMEIAYTDAAGRTLPDHTELGAGNIGGMTLAPGLYKWGTGVTIPTDVTLSGNSSDVWVFQIAQTLDISPAKSVILSGGALAQNIFWQVGGQTTLGTTSVFNGIILSQTAVVLNTGATLNGKALAQTAVTLDANTVSLSGTAIADILPPVITINGSNSVNVTQNTNYTDAGATALDNVSGVVAVFSTGTVNVSANGTYTITYNATDAADNLATKTRTVNVLQAQPVLRTITVSPAAATIIIGSVQKLNATSFDQFGAPIAGIISYASSNSSVATVNASGLVTAVAAGSASINATSGNGNATSAITVETAAPILSYTGPRSVTQATWLNFTITATSPSGFNLTFTPGGKPATANFTDNNNGTAVFSWMPNASNIGMNSVNFTVTDGIKNTTEAVAITVNLFEAPTTLATNWNAWKNADFNITLNATGFNSTPVAYINYTLNNATGQFTGTNGNISVNTSGNNTLVFYAVDTSGNVETPHTIYALLDKTAPNIISFTLSSTSVNVGTGITGTCTVTDNLHTNIAGAITGIDTTTAGAKTATCTATDLAGNTAATTATYTVNAVPSSGGSSDGSGGGSSVSQNPTTTTASASHKWDLIDAGLVATMGINNDKIAIRQIWINAIKQLINPSLQIYSLSENPTSVAAAPKVYQYLQLTPAGIASSDISSVVISFTVPSSWLKANNVIDGDIAMYRFSNNKWNMLPTTKMGTEGSAVVYQANSPGFSYFAIGNKPAETSTPSTTSQATNSGITGQNTGTTTTQNNVTTGQGTNAIAPIGNQLTGQVISQNGFKAPWWIMALVLFALVGLIIGGYIYYTGGEDKMANKQRMKSDMSTSDRRELADKTMKGSRARNDELTLERRSRADETMDDNRLRNDELTAHRRAMKDGNFGAALAIASLILIILVAGVFFIFI